LRAAGIHADYLDATVGFSDTDLQESFYRRVPMENGRVRCGLSPDSLAEIFAKYDIVATSSIFTIQTRMHFEVAAIVKKVARDMGKEILTVSGGVNARSLREHFLSNNFDIIGLADGEKTMVQIVDQFVSPTPDYSQVSRIAFRDGDETVLTPGHLDPRGKFIDFIAPPALDALPLETYGLLGIPHAGYPMPGTKFTAIQTSRGCQDKCTFCHISLEKIETDLVGRIGFLRMFSNERVGEDVQRAVDLGVKRLYFEDDNLFFNKKRLMALRPYLKRDGLEYSNVNGANLRFLVKKEEGGYVVDNEFINGLADFGLRELSLPFETRSPEMMEKYASGKYDPDTMNPIGILQAVRKAGIRATSNFLIGFKDESWESIIRTRDFAKQLFDAGLDSAGFAIPVPYPGSIDFEVLMRDKDLKKTFDDNLLAYTDEMRVHGKPLFPTVVPAERLQAAVKEFWEELNSANYTKASTLMNMS
jgi:radical SAM superfamily enzyme YgiQ (UPF0313 family)